MTKSFFKFMVAIATIVCGSLLIAFFAGVLIHAVWKFFNEVVQLFLLGWDLVGGFKH